MAKKSKVVKKAAPKKAVAKKPMAGKTTVKKAAPKKATAKPASPKGRKVVSKPAAPKTKNPVAKKATPKKVTTPKRSVTKPASTAERKKAAAKPNKISAASTPAMAELSEEMHEKAVTKEKQNQSMMQSAEGAKQLERKEDPIMAFDMHMAQKAASKGDRNNKLRVSSTGHRPLRPSGKKPLW